MKRFVLLLLSIIALYSCSEQYTIDGNTSQNILDGRMAYIKEFQNNVLKSIDSCEVIHGKFNMSGSIDSVRCVAFFMDDRNIQPVVLEKGNISISIVDASVRVSGTPLNDSLYSFLVIRDSLDMILNELPHLADKMILEGYDDMDINMELNDRAAVISRQIDKLETHFIENNFDNILSVAWFMQLCNNAYQFYGYPTTTPQIDEIYGKAPKHFKENPDVKHYMKLVNGE